MSELVKQLWSVVGALVVLAVLAPIVIRLVAAVLPVLLAVVGVIVGVRLVWFYTNR